MIDRLQYQSGYKYQVYEVFQCDTGIVGNPTFLSRFLSLSDTGLLTVSPGYAWDGASGPAINTPDFVRGSLVHDALYQLMREGKLPLSFRKRADELLVEICKEDGMWWPRRQWVLLAVRKFGAMAVKSENPVLYAPAD